MVWLVNKAPHTPKNFDPVKLEGMIEPLSVRVEKKRGNARTVIPLPAGADGAPQGTNLSKEDVKGLEQWLVNEWSGGGFYAITVMDSNGPTPQKLEWEIYYQPSEYPEKIPPTLSAAAVAPAPQLQPQVRPMTTGFPSAFPNGFPAGMGPLAQPQMAQLGQPYYPPQFPTTQLYGGANDADRRRHEDQLRDLQLQLAKAREDQMQAEHRRELERAEARRQADVQAQNDRFSKLEQLIATIAQGQLAKPANDPQLEQLREQNRLLEARLEADRRERETERREREMQDQMRRQAEETQRQIEALRALAETGNKGMDPMMMMLQQSAQQNTEAIKEVARQSTMQLERMQAFMMAPRDIVAMVKESSNGIDQTTREISSAYQSILQMSRQAVEQALEINNPGGSETIALVKEGIERASSFAERYIGGKVKEATVAQQAGAAHAQAQAAQAQAQAVTIQAQVRAQELAAVQAARQAAAQASAGVTQPTAGVNGAGHQPPVTAAVPVVAAVAGPAGETREAQTSSAPLPNTNQAGAQWSTGPVPAVANINDAKVRRHLGRTDQEWFGPILPNVMELRAGVAKFVESIQQKPARVLPNGKIDGAEPREAAEAILQAAMMIQQQQLPIAAMTDLLQQGRIADFLDVLLPDSPQGYRDDVAQAVLKAVNDGDGEDEDDDLEDDEDPDADENDGQPTPTKAARPNEPRARA